jgi:hypothetical protein
MTVEKKKGVFTDEEYKFAQKAFDDTVEGISYYDHTISETPLGTIIIEWKSWKERPSYDIMLNGEWLGVENNLPDAKTVALKHVLDKSQELITFLINN